MSTLDRAAVAKAFKLARRALWNGKPDNVWGCKYICDALRITGAHCPDADGVGASSIVMARIAPAASMEMWLQLQGVELPEDPVQFHRATQRHRRKWLKQLAQEFSQ